MSMKRIFTILLLLGGLAGLATPGQAQTPQQIGVVLLHGKLGQPMGFGRGGSAGPGAQLIAQLSNAGYLVVEPEMCWSATRRFDRSYTDCFGDIDAAIAGLKARGATGFVVGGLSLGGNVAIGYGASHPGLLGIIGLSPADDPVRKARDPKVADSIATARDLIAQGKGDVTESFNDRNTGPGGSYAMTIETTPRIFLSFADENAPAHIPTSVAKLTMPLLWVAGDRDPTQQGGPAFAFDKAPPNPLNRYVVVSANHIGVPDAAAPAVLAWLAELRKP
jgi:pimeloyl-ACP methyl ester carboxylesterase